MSQGFEEYCKNTRLGFTAEGYPDPISVPQKLANALLDVLKQYEPSMEAVEDAAMHIHSEAERGKAEGHASNLTASKSRSERELREFHMMTERLVDLIEGMHNPAIAALSREGVIARHLLDPLRRAHEVSGYAIGGLENLADRNPGSKRNMKVQRVTDATWVFFEEIAKKPGTRSYAEGEYGVFVDTLSAVFSALGIRASAGKQAQTRITKANAKR